MASLLQGVVYRHHKGTTVFLITNRLKDNSLKTLFFHISSTLTGKPDPPIISYRFSPTKTIILTWKSEREDIDKFDVIVKHGTKVVKEETTTEKLIEFKGLESDVLYTFEVTAIDVSSQKSDVAIMKMKGNVKYDDLDAQCWRRSFLFNQI